MKEFLGPDFLLDSEPARRLYHDYAEGQPIVDYHCHLDPRQIAEDMRYQNITEVWLGGDHYKWRAMRACGVPEEDIACRFEDPWRTFRRWSETLPRCVGNPLYHWTYLELQNYFGIREELSAESARRIYDACNERLAQADMSVRGIIKRSGVRVICTTDDPADTLEWHRRLRDDASFSTQVLPAFRPDKALNIDKEGFASYLHRLGESADIEITSFSRLIQALEKRVDFFEANGCRVSDHALEYVMYRPAGVTRLDAILRKSLRGERVDREEAEAFRTAVLLELAGFYRRYGWAMQLHFGCLRGVNTRCTERFGPDTGFDAVSNNRGTDALGALLDALDKRGALPKMILYSLNQHDNEAIASLAGCFQSDGVCPGQIQLGSAWWYNDSKTGMEKQLTDLGNIGVLGTFIGMLTDSRSFLSYARHEYFRRILCGWIGRMVENGELHPNLPALGELVRDVSYRNAVRYFGFDC